MPNALQNLWKLIHCGAFLKAGTTASDAELLSQSVAESKLPGSVAKMRSHILGSCGNNVKHLNTVAAPIITATLSAIQAEAKLALNRTSFGRDALTTELYKMLSDLNPEPLHKYLNNEARVNELIKTALSIKQDPSDNRGALSECFGIACRSNNMVAKLFINGASEVTFKEEKPQPATPDTISTSTSSGAGVRRTADGMYETTNTMREAMGAAARRGETINRLEDRTAQLADRAKSYAANAEELARRAKAAPEIKGCGCFPWSW